MSEHVKVVEIKMPDGSVWQFPAGPIAVSRAAYYAEKEGKVSGDEEYEFTLRDEDTLIEWAQNNMNWSDVKALAVMVKEPDPPDFDEAWNDSSNFSVKEVVK